MPDILIRTKPENIKHKMEPGKEYYWTLGTTPKNVKSGDLIMFTDGKKVFAQSKIIGVGYKRIYFKPLKKVNKQQPKKAPSRGFTYVNWWEKK